MGSRHRIHAATEWAELGIRLRDARLKAGMTQLSAAALLGRDQSFMGKIERGERQLTALELRDLCRGYGVTVDSVIEP